MVEIPVPFKIGETLWHAARNHHEEKVQCPECMGTRVITMTLGTGERVALDCEMCRVGWDSARGWVTRSVLTFRAEKFMTVDLEFRSLGEVVYINDRGLRADARVLFPGLEECRVECSRLQQEHDRGREAMMMANLESKRKHLAFSAHYWKRKIVDLEKDLERCRARLAVCPEPRVKKEPPCQTPIV